MKSYTRRTRLLLALAALTAATSVFQAQQSRDTAVHTFRQVRPGVYAALPTGNMETGSNSVVIVNDDDVLVVDSHATPGSFRALLNEIKTLTDKPVRYVVNTHFHFDHSDGNQILPPDVMVFGHEFTRAKLLTDVFHEATYADELDAQPRRAATLQTRLTSERDASQRAALEQQLAMTREYEAGLKESRPIPPNVTFQNTMTLFRGGREIRLLFLGRGHTGGDVIVYLPRERVVCTGDVLVNGIAFMGDAFVDEWPSQLEKLKAIDYDVAVPGHGEPLRGKANIDTFEGYLRELWRQANALHAKRLSAGDAAKQIDMTAYKAQYPSIRGVGVDPAEVTRMYAVMDGRAER
jgi:cyclase